MTTWFTSDTHFGHANAITFTDRPFGDVDAMTEGLLAVINKRVTATDQLYVLGDFSFKLNLAQARAVRERINCQNVHLVPGNHDRDWSNVNEPLTRGVFIVEPPIKVIKAQRRKIVMSHYPMMDWQGLGHAAIHLHGHIHAPAAYNERNRSLRLLRYDVGVDANGYAPVSLEQIREFFDGVEHRQCVDWTQWAVLANGALDEAVQNQKRDNTQSKWKRPSRREF